MRGYVGRGRVLELRELLAETARLLDAIPFAEWVEDELDDADLDLRELRRSCSGRRPFPSQDSLDLIARFGADTSPPVVWRTLVAIERRQGGS